MTILQFIDKAVPYNIFIKDVAAEVVHALKTDSNDPEYVSQRKAYSMFGRANVDRWKEQRRIIPLVRNCLNLIQ